MTEYVATTDAIYQSSDNTLFNKLLRDKIDQAIEEGLKLRPDYEQDDKMENLANDFCMKVMSRLPEVVKVAARNRASVVIKVLRPCALHWGNIRFAKIVFDKLKAFDDRFEVREHGPFDDLPVKIFFNDDRFEAFPGEEYFVD